MESDDGRRTRDEWTDGQRLPKGVGECHHVKSRRAGPKDWKTLVTCLSESTKETGHLAHEEWKTLVIPRAERDAVGPNRLRPLTRRRRKVGTSLRVTVLRAPSVQSGVSICLTRGSSGRF